MKATNENKEYLRQTEGIDFLTERWEIKWYARVLKEAADWAESVDKKNGKSSLIKSLKFRYNSVN